jgi:ATP-dependent DNA helicase 2 subunit 1
LCAICTYIAKSNSAPVMAALIPHGEIFDQETKRQEQSPGFFLIRLPFVEDVRSLSLPDTNVAHVMGGDPTINSMRLAQVEAAKKIVQTVSEEEWEPSILDNPALQQCYVSLEAMALNLDADQIGSVADLLSADPAKINRIANEAVGNWLTALRISSTDACALGAAATAPKREYIKAEVPESARFTIEQVRQLNADGQLGKLSVVDMKAIINSYPEVFKNVNSQGRKPELMEKIRLNI